MTPHYTSKCGVSKFGARFRSLRGEENSETLSSKLVPVKTGILNKYEYQNSND